MKRMYGVVFAMSILISNHLVATTKSEVREVFDRFVAAQNAHDAEAVRELLMDSPDFLWITNGTPVWGRDRALNRFELLYEGTWRLEPDTSAIRVMILSPKSAQLFVPVTFMIGAPGREAQPKRFLMNQVLVKTEKGWRISSILPILLPAQ